MKNSVLMRSINTLYFRQNNSLIFKLTSGQRKNLILLVFLKSLYTCIAGLNKRTN
jgi:hypothetical protein